jgi:phage baseplate assembly protein W
MIDLKLSPSGDLTTSPTGDLAGIDGLAKSRDRVLRRLLTPPGSYLAHPEYGAGLQMLIGRPIDGKAIQALILGQMYQEATVSHVPEPTITVSTDNAGDVYVSIVYICVPNNQQVALGIGLSSNGVSIY